MVLDHDLDGMKWTYLACGHGSDVVEGTEKTMTQQQTPVTSGTWTTMARQELAHLLAEIPAIIESSEGYGFPATMKADSTVAERELLAALRFAQDYDDCRLIEDEVDQNARPFNDKYDAVSKREESYRAWRAARAAQEGK